MPIRHGGKIATELLASHRLPEHHAARSIHPMQREHPLCQIDPQRSNLFHDFPSRSD
jgi:hypothetical protein